MGIVWYLGPNARRASRGTPEHFGDRSSAMPDQRCVLDNRKGFGPVNNPLASRGRTIFRFEFFSLRSNASAAITQIGAVRPQSRGNSNSSRRGAKKYLPTELPGAVN